MSMIDMASEKAAVLRRYSAGEISRYDAMEALGLSEFSALEAALQAHGLTPYELPRQQSQQALDRLSRRLRRGEPS